MLSATHFAVIGDFGASDSTEANVAALVKSWNPDYILTVGDNNYPVGSASTIDLNIGQYYHDFIYPYLGNYGGGATTNRFFPTLGNHDWGDSYPNPTGDQPYLDYFTLPSNERYYTFTAGPVQYFALDSDGNEPDGTLATSTQATWLQTQLAASTATYKIVYFHHPPYSSTSWSETNEARWPFQAWGATAVLTGHAHNYERLIEDNNFPYFVNGLGGNENVDPFDRIETGSQVRYNGDNGAMFVTADETQMQFQFITRTGAVIDTYTIPAPVPQVSTTLVSSGAVWNYLDNGSNQGTAWQGTAFNDSTWSSGAAQLGYGDGDEQTVVGFGGNSSNKYVTTYFRRSFAVPDPSVAANGLTLNLLRDDGAVVYLNGVEVFRSNLPAGTIGYQTLASGPVTGSDESAWYSITFNSSLLLAGINVLAVELHQSDTASSDISFDLSLIGTQILTPNTASSLVLAGFPSSIQAGTAANFTVTALDGSGNVAADYRGTIHFSSSDAQAVLPADYIFTAADNGTHTFSATLKTAGSQTLVATDTVTSTIVASQTVTLQGSPGDFNNNGAVDVADYVVWRRGFGTTYTNADYQVWRSHFGETAGGGASSGLLPQTHSVAAATANSGATYIPGSDLRSNLSADCTFSATLQTEGRSSPAAIATGTSLIAGTQSITVQPAAASTLRVSELAATQAGLAGTFTVTVLDPFGNTATGYNGTLHFSSSDAQATLPADYTFTNADGGAHTFTATFKTTGSQMLTATDVVTSSITGNQPVIVQPAAASAVRVNGFPSTAQAGVAAGITVAALDAYGNAAVGYRGTIHFSSSDNRAILPANYTFTSTDTGVHTFSATLKTAGSQSLTATDTVTSSITGTQTVTVQPAVASTMRVTGFPSPIQAGVAGSFTVTVLDTYGNIAAGYRGTTHFSSSDNQSVLPANYIFTAGDAAVHTFSATLKTAGSRSLTAADTITTSISGTQTITIQPAAASSLRISGFPSPIKAGATKSFKVTVVDAYGNVATGYRATIHFSSTDPRAVLPANYTFTAADNGAHTFSATLKTKGLQSLIVTDTVTTSITGSQTILVK